MFKNKLALIGAGIIFLLIISAVFAPFFAPYDPLEQNIIEGLSTPNKAHWFGSKRLGGRDIF